MSPPYRCIADCLRFQVVSAQYLLIPGHCPAGVCPQPRTQGSQRSFGWSGSCQRILCLLGRMSIVGTFPCYYNIYNIIAKPQYSLFPYLPLGKVFMSKNFCTL